MRVLCLLIFMAVSSRGFSQGFPPGTIQPQITGIPSVICLTPTIYELIGSPSGGVFTGDGIVNGNQFNPFEAGIAEHTITYTVQTSSGTVFTSITVEVVPEFVVNVDSVLCDGQVYTVPDGTEFTAPAVLDYAIIDPSGCTTRYNLNLQEVPDNPIVIDAFFCSEEGYTLPGGQVVFPSQTTTYEYLLPPVLPGDCPTNYQVTVTPYPAAEDQFVSSSHCPNEFVVLPNGQTVTSSGIYNGTANNENGCPFNFTYVLEFIPSNDIVDEESICEGESYLLPNGLSVNVPGDYPVVMTNENGCQYTFTTRLFVLPTPPFIGTSVILCEGETYTLPNGVTVNQGEVYEGTYVPPGGDPFCEGRFSVSISLELPTFNSGVFQICRGESVLLPNGEIVTPSEDLQVYSGTKDNPNGNCPIIWTRTVQFRVTFPSDSIYVDLCEGEEHQLPDGSWVNTAGVYVNPFSTEDGCPYTITTFITVIPATASQTVNICPGETFVFPDGSTTSTPGVFVVQVSNGVGCNTETTYTIQFFQLNNEVLDVEICPGNDYELADGSLVTQAGTYVTPVPDLQTGCTRTITVNLSFYSIPSPTITEVSICAGEQYELFPGIFVNQSGDYEIDRETAQNCGYVDILRLTVLPAQNQTVTATIASGALYTLPDGLVVNAPGTYTSTVIGANGCTLEITTILSVSNPEQPACNAITIVDYQPGTTKMGEAVVPERQEASLALGEAQPTQNGVVNFVSLGFGGQITLDFGGPINNGEGADIEVFETTWNNQNCQSYPEKAEIFVSQNGCDFVYAGVVCTNGGSVDISPLLWAQFVRIVDVSDPSDFSDNHADGFDVNAIACLNGEGAYTVNGLQSGSLQTIVAYQPGLRKNNTPVLEQRRQTDKALGTTLSEGQQIEFVSLGFGGSLTGRFDFVVFNREAGAELQVIETTFGNLTCSRYPETARFFVSQHNNNDWVELPGLCQDGTLEIGQLKWFQYLKIVDNSPIASNRFNGVADGYDVDAVLTIGTCGQVARQGQLEELETTAQADEIGEIRLFPNPVESFIQLEFQGFDGKQPIQYEVTDMQGRLVQAGQLPVSGSAGTAVLPAEKLVPGVYTLRLLSDQMDTVLRFVK